MNLETFIRLLNHLIITSEPESESGDFLGWSFTSSKRTKAIFTDPFSGSCLRRYEHVLRILDELHIDNIEVACEASFDATKIDFNYHLMLTIDDDEY